MIVATEIVSVLMDQYYSRQHVQNPVSRAQALLQSMKLRYRHRKIRGGAICPPLDSWWLSEAVEILSSPVLDIELLAEQHLHATVDIDDLRPLDQVAGAPVFGLCRTRARSIIVCRRALRYEPLLRATLAHETAHLVLHSNRDNEHAYSPKSRNRPMIEREADAFMVELIAPRPLIALAIVFVSAINRLDLRHAITMASEPTGRHQWHRYYFPFIVERLCVSRELVAIALLKRRIFDRETVQWHLTKSSRNCWIREPKPLRRPMELLMAGLVSARNN